MKTAHKLTALAVLALALTGCGAGEEATTAEQTSSAPATATATATATASETAAPSETTPPPSKLGEAEIYKSAATSDPVLSVVVESVEPITAEQCTTTWFDGIDEGKQLVKLNITAELGTAQTISTTELETPVEVSPFDWGWIDAEGYKIESAWDQTCLTSAETPAMSLSPEQKTRGAIVLEIPESDISAGRPFFEAWWASGMPLEWEQ